MLYKHLAVPLIHPRTVVQMLVIIILIVEYWYTMTDQVYCAKKINPLI